MKMTLPTNKARESQRLPRPAAPRGTRGVADERRDHASQMRSCIWFWSAMTKRCMRTTYEKRSACCLVTPERGARTASPDPERPDRRPPGGASHRSACPASGLEGEEPSHPRPDPEALGLVRGHVDPQHEVGGVPRGGQRARPGQDLVDGALVYVGLQDPARAMG